MAKHQNELVDTCEQAPNGPKLMRRTIVAVRVFLERSWLPANWGEDRDFAEREDDNKPEALKRLEARASDEGEVEDRGGEGVGGRCGGLGRVADGWGCRGLLSG